jgi:signal recognition particle subunit SRP54
VLTSIKPSQLLIKITHQELTELMGSAAADFKPAGNPFTILMAGLQGAGKTTHSGKIAQLLKTRHGKKPLLVACDVHRPAAVDQLQVLGESIGIEVYAEPESKDAPGIAKNALEYAKSNGFNAVIFDTAGRLAIDEVMMAEIMEVRDIVKPTEILFTVDAMTGQDAVRTAKHSMKPSTLQVWFSPS